MNRIAAVAFAVAFMSGCAFFKEATAYHPPSPPPPPEVLTDAEAAIRVQKADPPEGYVDVGPVSAIDGRGCGVFEGATGTFERAMMLFKKSAAAKGASYVQLLNIKEPGQSDRCNEYSLSGMAYRKP